MMYQWCIRSMCSSVDDLSEVFAVLSCLPAVDSTRLPFVPLMLLFVWFTRAGVEGPLSPSVVRLVVFSLGCID